MLEMLQGSGLDEKDARKLDYQPFAKEALLQHYPTLTALPAAGFTIPYHDRHGKSTGFYRFRYLEEPQRKGFAALVEQKSSRYIQPAKSAPRVYFSKLFDWESYFSRKNAEERSLIITEGEKKAACATKLTLPVLGLGGVWNWRAQGKLIPDLEELDWKNVSVHICYDSDARSNAQIAMAENALASELLNRGAIVSVMRLPQLADQKKTGLDDFLLSEGFDAFMDVYSNTEFWAASKALHQLNAEVVFVRDPGLVLEVKTQQRMSPSTFSQAVYANRILENVIIKDQKEKIVKKPAAKMWLEWPARSEVTRITYKPGEAKITEDGEYNTWSGWGLNGEVAPGDIKLYEKLRDSLFAGLTPENLTWFEQWLAYPLQHPGAKQFTAVVLWSLQHGIGKTLIGHTMRRIYGTNFAEIGNKDLDSQFNSHVVNKQFILGDEIAGGEKRQLSDRMKSMITQLFVRVNQKYVPEYEIPDCVNYLFTSNHPNSFFMENDDRRYFVHEVISPKLSDAFYKEYDTWYRSERVGALFSYLLNLDLTGYNPLAAAPITNSKREMIANGRSDAEDWAAHALENPEDVGIRCALMTTGEVYALYTGGDKKQISQIGFGRVLKQAGFKKANNGETILTASRGPQRLWVVKDFPETLSKNSRQLALVYDEMHKNAAEFHKRQRF